MTGPVAGLMTGPATPSTPDVSVQHARSEAARRHPLGQLLSDDHRAVTSTRAPDRDREVRLALLHECRQQEPEELVELGEERVALGLPEDIGAHVVVEPGLRSQRVDPVRVRQEARVEHEVDVEREAVLVAERDDRRLQAGPSLAPEQVEQPVAQLVDVELGGVDDHVGLGLDRLEELPLALDALPYPLALGEGVTPAGVLVTADEHLVRRLEEQNANVGAGLAELVERGCELLEVGAGANRQRDPLGRGARRLHELGHLGDEGRGKVVDDEAAQVLERVGRLRSSCTRETGDDDELAHVRLRIPTPPTFSARRNSRRGIVAASRYSAARARNPGGGAGSSMRVTSRPAAIIALT